MARWICAETVPHALIISYQVNIANIWYRTTIVWKGQATLGHPFPPPVKHLYTNHLPHHLDIWIHIMQSSAFSISIRTKPEVIRRKQSCTKSWMACLSKVNGASCREFNMPPTLDCDMHGKIRYYYGPSKSVAYSLDRKINICAFSMWVTLLVNHINVSQKCVLLLRFSEFNDVLKYNTYSQTVQISN